MKVEELKNKIAAGEAVEIIDIREPAEVVEQAMIPGAENVPMGQMFTEAAKGELPKDKKIVTVCRSGGRCEIVVNELRQKGYDIDYLEGGMNAWSSDQ